MSRSSTRYRVPVLFTTLAVVWGLSFVAIKDGLSSFPPVMFAALRHDIASVLLLGSAVVLGKDWLPRTRDDIAVILIGGVMIIGGHYALLFIGQQYVPSAIGAIILSLTPVLTPMFALLLLPHEHLSRSGVVGVVLGLLGVIVIANPDPANLNGQFLGIALLFGSAASFAIGAVLTERHTPALPLLSVQAWMMTLGSGILHGISILRPQETIGDVTLTTDGLVALIFLGVFASALALLIYFELMRTVGPNDTSLVNYVTPIVAAVGGWLLLGEQLTAATLFGFALIVTGFVVLKVNRIRMWIWGSRAADNPELVVSNQEDYVIAHDDVYVSDASHSSDYDPAD